MYQSKIAVICMYVPNNVYTNSVLTRFMDTIDEWIRDRTGIQQRHFADRTGETTTTMAIEAAKLAIERAGTTAQDIDFIVFATLTPDYYFPGCGRSEEHTSELQSLMRISYAVFCLKNKNTTRHQHLTNILLKANN